MCICINEQLAFKEKISNHKSLILKALSHLQIIFTSKFLQAVCNVSQLKRVHQIAFTYNPRFCKTTA